MYRTNECGAERNVVKGRERERNMDGFIMVLLFGPFGVFIIELRSVSIFIPKLMKWSLPVNISV